MTSQRRTQSGKLSRKNRAINLEQLENRMMCTVSGLEQSLQSLLAPWQSPNISAQANNAAPTVAKPINSNGRAVSVVTSKSISLSALGADDGRESSLTYTWSVIQAPVGATTTFSANGNNAAKNTVLTFSKAGIYNARLTITDSAGKSVVSIQRIEVVQSVNRIAVSTGSQVLSSDAVINTSGTSVEVQAQVLDQFGAVITRLNSPSWKGTLAPTGGSQTLKVQGNSATVAFSKAGLYAVEFKIGGYATRFKINVAQSLTSIQLTPGSSEVAAGKTQQFTAVGLDQFRAAMATQPTFTWSASSGTISAQGLYTAPGAAGNYTITVTAGSIRAQSTAKVTVPAPASGFQNASISSLVQTYYADGSITRTEMMQLLRAAGSDGSVDNSELTDLRYVVSNATRFNIAGYVQVLAGNVVNTNPANSLYQGVASGNLSAGSTATQLNNLVDKWFLGTDRPTLSNGSLTYRAASGTLFVGAPSYANEKQGMLGDCYFIAALGSMGTSYADAVKNMFVDNGDGTYTVRFYGGTYGAYYNADGTISEGFSSGAGVADYVTVDRMLPANSNGTFAYSNYGAGLSNTANVLWIALAEKAYAQWNATGKSGRTPANSYASIEGGWMGNVNAQVLGYNSTRYSSANGSNKQALIAALNAGNAVTVGSQSNSTAIVGSHAYSITAYDASTDTFTLFNPWGTSHPAPLTWAQIQSNTTYFVVANASQSSPIRSSAAGGIASVRSDVQQCFAYVVTVTSNTDSNDEMVVLEVAPSQSVESSPATTSFAATAVADQDSIDEFQLTSEENSDAVAARSAVDMLLDIDRIEELLNDLLC